MLHCLWYSTPIALAKNPYSQLVILYTLSYDSLNLILNPVTLSPQSNPLSYIPCNMTSSISSFIPLRPLHNPTRYPIYLLTWLGQSHPSFRYTLSPIQPLNSSFSSHCSDRHDLFKPTSGTRHALLNLILQLVSSSQIWYCSLSTVILYSLYFNNNFDKEVWGVQRFPKSSTQSTRKHGSSKYIYDKNVYCTRTNSLTFNVRQNIVV